MLWYRTNNTIIEQWKTDAAYGLEAGEKPVFNLGSSNTSLDGLVGLTTLQEMIEKRDSIVQPLVTLGGHSALWLFALLQTTRDHAQLQAPKETAYGSRLYDQIKSPTVIFTGVDSATQIAALTTQTSTVNASETTTVSPKERWTGLNISMRHYFAPTSEPSAISPVASLPFTTEPLRAQHAIDRYTKVVTIQPPTLQPKSPTSADEETAWTARAMIGLAFLLLLTALFI